MTDEQDVRHGYTYNPLSRPTFEAMSYNAIGRASEVATYATLKLTHSTGNSGWSVGALQWDFGQPGRGDKVNDLMAGYQAWAAFDQKFTDEEVASLTGRMQTRGQVGNTLSNDEQAKLNTYLRSDPGREFVGTLNQIQVERKWNNVGLPMSEIGWLQRLSATDPNQAAEIVTMTSKLFNQNENKGGQLIRHLQNAELTSDQTRDWIGSEGVARLNPSARAAIIAGRDSALAGISLMNDLEQGGGRISQAWREQIHAKGNVSLSLDFNDNPDVQLLDGMMRYPAAGERIFSHVEEGGPASAATIVGIDANARLEMSRTVQDPDGRLSIHSPNGDVYEMTADSWNRNGTPMAIAQSARAAPSEEREWGSFTPNLSMANGAAGAVEYDGQVQRQTEDSTDRVRMIDNDRAPSNAIPAGQPVAPGATISSPERTHLDNPPVLTYTDPTLRPSSDAQSSSVDRMPTSHPDYPLFAQIRERLPHGASDAVAAHVTLGAKMGGIGAGEITRFEVHGDRAFMLGRIPGDKAAVDLAQAPALQETLQRSQAFDQQQSVAMAHLADRQQGRDQQDRGQQV